MLLQDLPEKTFTARRKIGIGIRGTYDLCGKLQLHIGLLYINEERKEQGYLCHLCEDMCLENEPIPSGEYYWLTTSIDEEDSFAVVSFCNAVCDPTKNFPGIPFGFSFRTGLFNPDGVWDGEIGEGLTCASFVLAILHQLKIEILQTSCWLKKPSEDKENDDLWKEYIYGHYKKQYGSERAAQLRIGDNSPRFRPEEVASGAHSDERPLDYDSAKKLGSLIRSEILARFG